MSYFYGEKSKSSNLTERYFWLFKNSEMASSEDKNAAGEVREEADGEVRVINTWCEIRTQYLNLMTISMFLDIYKQ